MNIYLRVKILCLGVLGHFQLEKKMLNLSIMIAVFFMGILELPIATQNPVSTKCGLIQGTQLPYNETQVSAFLGIPYAQPPVGDLRFEKTVPVRAWSGCLQATHFRPACLQHHPPDYPWVDNSTLQSEDCLYLNIYVPPRTNSSSKKAVMFWIPGGAFTYGSGNLPVYDGRVLATEGDVIVITINYRLGILGFLSSEEAPGNMGLHDIIEALKWVKVNVDSFGGDPDNITIFGESAGGRTVSLFCVSPKAKGLFKRIIMQSGSAAHSTNDYRKQNEALGQKVAKAIGCADGDIIQCFKTKNARELIETTFSVHPEHRSFYTIVGDDVLPTEPQTVLKSGLFNDADVMMGHLQDEGSFFLTSVDQLTFGTFGEKNPNINKTTGTNYILQFFKDNPDKERIVHHYLGELSEDDFGAILEQTYHSLGDYKTVCPNTYFSELYSRKGKSVYAYYFNHVPSVTPWAPWMGSVHFDEVAFMFGRPLDHPLLYTSEEADLSRALIRAWTNFAKYGSPGENWQMFSRSNPYFKVFNISNRKSYLESHIENCDFFRPILGFE